MDSTKKRPKDDDNDTVAEFPMKDAGDAADDAEITTPDDDPENETINDIKKTQKEGTIHTLMLRKMPV